MSHNTETYGESITMSMKLAHLRMSVEGIVVGLSERPEVLTLEELGEIAGMVETLFDTLETLVERLDNLGTNNEG